MRIVDAGWRKTLRLSLAAGTAAVALVATGAAASGASAANDVSSAKGASGASAAGGGGGGGPVVATAGGLLRGTTGREAALAATTAGRAVGGRARRDQLRAALPADGVSLRRGQHVRGLPVPERLHPVRR